MSILYRKESDSIGEIEVDENFYWGSQTQRSINNFKIADQKMPKEVIKALAILKRSAAIVNSKIGVLEPTHCEFSNVKILCSNALSFNSLQVY